MSGIEHVTTVSVPGIPAWTLGIERTGRTALLLQW